MTSYVSTYWDGATYENALAHSSPSAVSTTSRPNMLSLESRFWSLGRPSRT